MRRQRRRRVPADPVANWDGIALITLPNGRLIEAEEYKRCGAAVTQALYDHLPKPVREAVAQGGDFVLAQYYPQLRFNG